MFCIGQQNTCADYGYSSQQKTKALGSIKIKLLRGETLWQLSSQNWGISDWFHSCVVIEETPSAAWHM